VQVGPLFDLDAPDLVPDAELVGSVDGHGSNRLLDRDGLIGADPGCTSASNASEANDLLCEVAMSQASYVDGEAVMIASLCFANQETVTVPARLRLELALPSGVTANALDLGADGSFALPASSENQRGPVTMFAAGPEIPLRGAFE
jgi:hypothetical protein